MSVSASSHLERAKLIALALFGLACGPPKVAGDADAESGDESSSSASSSSETGTTTTSTTETTVTTGFDVPGPRDLLVAECDSFLQDCPEGEKCVPYSTTGGNWDASKCVPITGSGAPGEPCTYGGTIESTDDCDATSFCWDVHDVDGMAVGTCHLFCTGTADEPECPEGFTCPIANDGVIFLCIPACDPILQDCSEGYACYWAAGYAFICWSTMQNIPPGEPCGFVNDCAEGSGCIGAAALPSCADAACCSPWCQLGAGDLPCEVLPGTTCVPFFEQGMAPPGYDHVGVCLLQP